MHADTQTDLGPLVPTGAPATDEANVAEAGASTAAAEAVDPISGDLTVTRAAEVREALVDRFGAPGPIEVVLSSVTSIDAAGLQLLLAARRAAASRGRELRFVDPSEPVRHLFDRIGLVP